MGNSNQHQHYDVPHILVGGAGGKLKGDRHLAYERKTVTTGNLLLSVLDMYGIHKDKQGDSTRQAREAVGRSTSSMLARGASSYRGAREGAHSIGAAGSELPTSREGRRAAPRVMVSTASPLGGLPG